MEARAAVTIAARIRSWVQGSGDRRMAARAEKILVAAATVIRGTFMLQLAVTMITSAERTLHPDGFLAMSGAMIIESVLMSAYMVVRGAYVQGVAIFDICFTAAVILVEPSMVHPRDLVGTWVSWGYAAAIAVAVPTAIGLKRWRIVIAGSALLTACYLVSLLPRPLLPGAVATALTNSLAIIGFAISCRLGGGFVRVMGEEADRAREAEARAAAMAQLERQRTLLHNHASVLSLLSQDINDPRLQDAARGAAARGARQIQALLADSVPLPERDARGDHYLLALTDAVAEEFSDLPLIKNLDLLGTATVDETTAEALTEGLRTLLWNIREHARCRKATVHGEVIGDGWVITVTDDGVGFDPTHSHRGWGLRVQAGTALERVGVQVTIDSAPGDGTRVQLTYDGVSR